MALTKEQRIELLKKAREAKKVKAEAKKAEKLANPPPKGRPKKKVEEKTLDLHLDEKKEEEVIPPADYSEPEVEEIVEVRKVPKKKKIIRKRVIQEYESGTDEEVEEIVEAPIRRTRPQQAKVKEVEKPIPLEEPKEPEKPRFAFNLFDY
jgi:hypothetical protein